MARPSSKRNRTSKGRTRAGARLIRRTAITAERRKTASSNPYEGSTLDDFLREEGFYEEATATAVKETIAWQISRVMAKLRLTKTEMAGRMGTSRAALDRLLDPKNESVTLSTLLRAAAALDVELHLTLRRPATR